MKFLVISNSKLSERIYEHLENLVIVKQGKTSTSAPKNIITYENVNEFLSKFGDDFPTLRHGAIVETNGVYEHVRVANKPSKQPRFTHNLNEAPLSIPFSLKDGTKCIFFANRIYTNVDWEKEIDVKASANITKQIAKILDPNGFITKIEEKKEEVKPVNPSVDRHLPPSEQRAMISKEYVYQSTFDLFSLIIARDLMGDLVEKDKWEVFMKTVNYVPGSVDKCSPIKSSDLPRLLEVGEFIQSNFSGTNDNEFLPPLFRYAMYLHTNRKKIASNKDDGKWYNLLLVFLKEWSNQGYLAYGETAKPCDSIVLESEKLSTPSEEDKDLAEKIANNLNEILSETASDIKVEAKPQSDTVMIEAVKRLSEEVEREAEKGDVKMEKENKNKTEAGVKINLVDPVTTSTRFTPNVQVIPKLLDKIVKENNYETDVNYDPVSGHIITNELVERVFDDLSRVDLDAVIMDICEGMNVMQSKLDSSSISSKEKAAISDRLDTFLVAGEFLRAFRLFIAKPTNLEKGFDYQIVRYIVGDGMNGTELIVWHTPSGFPIIIGFTVFYILEQYSKLGKRTTMKFNRRDEDELTSFFNSNYAFFRSVITTSKTVNGSFGWQKAETVKHVLDEEMKDNEKDSLV